MIDLPILSRDLPWLLLVYLLLAGRIDLSGLALRLTYHPNDNLVSRYKTKNVIFKLVDTVRFELS